MNTDQILALYDEQERKNGEHPSYRRQVTPELTRHISKDPQWLSFIIYSNLASENADVIIRREIDSYRQRDGRGLEWKTYGHDLPPDLPKRLAEHGFEADEEEALLVMDLQECPDIYRQPVQIDVRKIGVAQLADVVAVQEAVYAAEFGWLAKQLRQNLTDEPDYWSIYVAYVDDNPACAAWISFPANSQFAGLWGGATLAAYRKMGLYTAVVATRAQEALKRGYRFLMVDASEMSRPILEKRGFQLLTHTTPYTWKNPDFNDKK
ncbi:MAG: GNAT family N-acetyltransferase [Chloroflexi bacterium]|nr:GNAT family N-acetyltransferase [Chloroflexota bacterium]